MLSFGEGSGEIHSTFVTCDGNENAISECGAFLNYRCSHTEDAGVSCLSGKMQHHISDL